MSAARQPAMTVEEFLAWEERQPSRYEFVHGRIQATVGGSTSHSSVKSNLITALVSRLRGKPCRAYDSDAKLRIGDEIRYPDAMISCTRQTDATKRRRGEIVEPVVVFEVTSPGTSLRDRIEKNGEYQALPSVMRYVMIEQDAVAATVFERRGEEWVGHLLTGPEALLQLPEAGVPPIPLAEFYADLEAIGPDTDDA